MQFVMADAPTLQGYGPGWSELLQTLAWFKPGFTLLNVCCDLDQVFLSNLCLPGF